MSLPIIVILDGNYSEPAHREAVVRFVSFVKSELATPVVRKWGPWSKTDDGKKAWARLATLADDLLCASITRPQYERALDLLAMDLTMPQVELRILARCALEFDRCCFFGAGHVPTVDIPPYRSGGAIDAIS